MKVRANVSFVGKVDGTKYRVDSGEEIEMPDGADWLNAGLVSPVKGKTEKAVASAPERATAPPQNTRSEVINAFGEAIGQQLIDAGFASLSSIPRDRDALMEIDGIGPARADEILEELA